MRIADLAKETGVSTQSVYRAVQRLGNRLEGHVSKKRGIAEVSEEGAALIRESLAQTTAKVIPVPAVQVAAPVDLSPIAGRLSQIERALLAIAEQNNGLVQANRQLQEIVRQQSAELTAIRAENSAIRGLLEAPKQIEPAERSFSDELAAAVAEIKATITGAFAPFVSWLRLG